MTKIFDPREINSRFAATFNKGDLDELLSFYEPDATHFNGRSPAVDRGRDQIRSALRQLLMIEGRMESNNRFCLIHDDLALLRADWAIRSTEGNVLFSGSSVELARKQMDEGWLMVIDNAVDASPI